MKFAANSAQAAHVAAWWAFALMPAVALAQEGAGGAQGPSLLETMFLPLALLAVMYFLVLRPQQKKLKDHQNLIEKLKVGDDVVTTGGLIGRVRSIADGFVSLETGNTQVKVLKANVTGWAKEAVGGAANCGEAAKKAANTKKSPAKGSSNGKRSSGKSAGAASAPST